MSKIIHIKQSAMSARDIQALKDDCLFYAGLAEKNLDTAIELAREFFEFCSKSDHENRLRAIARAVSFRRHSPDSIVDIAKKIYSTFLYDGSRE